MRVAPRIVLAVAGLFLATASLHAQQNIDSGSILTLAAQGLGQVASTDQSNTTSSSLKCAANLTAVSGGLVQIAIQGRDRGSGQYYNVFSTPGLSGAGVYPISIGRGISASLLTGPYVVNDFVPATWRVVATVLGGSAPSVTGSVGCSLIN